jgi:hypothetical protein
MIITGLGFRRKYLMIIWNLLWVAIYGVRFYSNQQFDINSDTIIHLMVGGSWLKKSFESIRLLWCQFELTKQLFDSFLMSILFFIIYSTVKTVAEMARKILLLNKTHYGTTATEQYILSHELAAGKRVYILRPCTWFLVQAIKEIWICYN